MIVFMLLLQEIDGLKHYIMLILKIKYVLKRIIQREQDRL